MKKAIRSFGILLLFLSIFPGSKASARSYDIIEYDVQIEINQNGDAVFGERITYNFSGGFEGVLRNIDIDGTDGYDKLKIYTEEGGNLREFTPGWNGNPGEYESTQDGNVLSLKVYEPTNNRQKTFLYTYILKNVAEKYKDIGIFNRKVIDMNWDVPLRDISISINIPEGASKEELKVFAHGPLEGYSEIMDDKTFFFYVNEIMPGSSVETLAIFPPRLIAHSQNAYDWDELPNILENEQKLADEANRIREEARAKTARREMQAKLRRMLSPVFLLMAFAALLLIVRINLKYGRDLKPRFDGDYYRELPGDYTPAVMTYLLKRKKTDSKDIMATLMDLVRKKGLKITSVAAKQRKMAFFKERSAKRYMLQKIEDADTEGFARHEVFLMDWFIDKLGDGKGIVLDELKGKLKSRSSAMEFQRDYENFKYLVKTEGSSKKFFITNDLTGAGKYIITALFLTALGITLCILVSAVFFGILFLILAILVSINLFYLRFKAKLSRYGIEQTAMWKAFKRFLLHFSNMKRADIPSIIIWEHYLVYAISLGIAKEVLAQLPKVFSETELNNPSLTFMGGYGYGFRSFHSMSSTMDNTIASVTRAVNTAAIAASRSSSGSGGGGGFSGGSSGGSGGGGGGGAF